MAARVIPERTEAANVLPFEPRKRPPRPASGRRVIALVLDDGTVRELSAEGRESAGSFRSGQLSGDRWILWWERRSFH